MLIKMPVMGKQEMQFWVHAFHLEKDIETAKAYLENDPRRKSAFCPILTTHEAGGMFFHIDEGRGV